MIYLFLCSDHVRNRRAEFAECRMAGTSIRLRSPRLAVLNLLKSQRGWNFQLNIVTIRTESLIPAHQ